MPTKTVTTPRMSDEAVKAKTGKVWKEWFAILDRAGAKKMSHQEIARYLHTEEGIGPWWTQMVAVTYEQAKGLRKKHQKPDGYQVSASKTINAPIEMLYESFVNVKLQKKWLDQDGLEIRTATANKSMRITWADKKTSVEVAFYPKSETKSMVTVQHSKLPTETAAAKLKAFWKNALERLQSSSET